MKRNRCDVFGPPTLFLLNVSFCFPRQRESLREQRKKDKSRFRFFGGRHQPSHTKTITNRQAEMKKREKTRKISVNKKPKRDFNYSPHSTLTGKYLKTNLPTSFKVNIVSKLFKINIQALVIAH